MKSYNSLRSPALTPTKVETRNATKRATDSKIARRAFCFTWLSQIPKG